MLHCVITIRQRYRQTDGRHAHSISRTVRVVFDDVLKVLVVERGSGAVGFRLDAGRHWDTVDQVDLLSTPNLHSLHFSSPSLLHIQAWARPRMSQWGGVMGMVSGKLRRQS